MILVKMTQKEAELFVLMRNLESRGVFDVRQGSVELFFDHEGKIRDITKHEHI